MSQLILITGGCRSGKSRYAVERAKKEGKRVLYIATYQLSPDDEEMQKRIERHRKERPADWDTIENRWDLDVVLEENQGKYDYFVIDCVTMWISYFLGRGENDAEILQRTNNFVGASLKPAPTVTVIAVTNEVGWGVVPESESGRRFRDLTGMVNQKLAQAADEVILMVAGMPMAVGADLRVRP